MIERGGASFSVKVDNCVSAGGSGAIIFNNKDGEEIDAELGASLGDYRKSIPVLTLPTSGGRSLRDNKIGEKVTLLVPEPAGLGVFMPLTKWHVRIYLFRLSLLDVLFLFFGFLFLFFVFVFVFD